MSIPNPDAEAPTMKRPQLRLAWLLWAVAIVAAFLGGVRYGEYREAIRRKSVTYNVTNLTLTHAEAAKILAKAKIRTQSIKFETGP
jgi:hypothetical protein